VPCTKASRFLPDFSALDEDVLARAAMVFVCTPSNPQGAVAALDDLCRYVELARKHDFLLVVDECYAEIYDREPPPGALDACLELGGALDNVLVFHSLSKRSSVPGLRLGFAAGDPEIVAKYLQFRAYSSPQIPLPLLAAGTALWREESHVERNRAKYRQKFDLAEDILSGRHGFYRPEAGFFLWLDVGDGEAATVKLWREAGVRVVPGGYLGRSGADGENPGERYIRIALVNDAETTAEALRRLVETL
jgi:aspartate/methionine/tyrosine aminotransferase